MNIMPPSKKPKSDYDADDIQVLKGLEGVN